MCPPKLIETTFFHCSFHLFLVDRFEGLFQGEDSVQLLAVLGVDDEDEDVDTTGMGDDSAGDDPVVALAPRANCKSVSDRLRPLMIRDAADMQFPFGLLGLLGD